MVHIQFAKQIVETLKSICDHNINYIDVNGRIYASTDEIRVGNYHDAGHEAAKTGKTITVEEDDISRGAKKGINMPIRFHGKTVAVIGITGPPDEVTKYAVLAQRITLMLLREHEMDIRDRNNQSQQQIAVRALTKNMDIDQDFLNEIFRNNDINMNKAGWKTILLKAHEGYHPANASLIESGIRDTFEKIGQNLHTYDYPNEYLVIAEEENLQKNMFRLRKLVDQYDRILKIGIGSTQTLRRQYISYESARIALSSLEEGSNIASFDEMDLQILLANVSGNIRDTYLEQTLGKLTEEDCEILKMYYDSDMSLKKTANSLFIHYNTLQYRLNRIREVSGYDPREFKQAVVLYIGIKILQLGTRTKAGKMIEDQKKTTGISEGGKR